MGNQLLTSLPNIGKTVSQRLNEIGVTNDAELKDVGAAAAYRRMSEKYIGKHLPVCYYLYSIEGAIQGRRWDDFSEKEKRDLRIQAGLSD